MVTCVRSSKSKIKQGIYTNRLLFDGIFENQPNEIHMRENVKIILIKFWF